MNLKSELEKYKMDFEIFEQELRKQSENCMCIPNLKFKFDRLSDEAWQLKSNLKKKNNHLMTQLEEYKMEFEIIGNEIKNKSEECFCISNIKAEQEKLYTKNQTLITNLEKEKYNSAKLIEKMRIAEKKVIKLEEKLFDLDSNQREVTRNTI